MGTIAVSWSPESRHCDVGKLLEQSGQNGMLGQVPGRCLDGFWYGFCFVHRILWHQRTISPDMILFCSVKIPWISDCGPGGHPGTYTSTGTI